jgi:hypothetical protein
MNAYLFYHPGTPADRDIEYLQRQLAERQIELQLQDANSRDGAALAELYDLTGRPAVLVTGSGGQLVQQWQGELPSADEIAYYYAVA